METEFVKNSFKDFEGIKRKVVLRKRGRDQNLIFFQVRIMNTFQAQLNEQVEKKTENVKESKDKSLMYNSSIKNDQ